MNKDSQISQFLDMSLLMSIEIFYFQTDLEETKRKIILYEEGIIGISSTSESYGIFDTFNKCKSSVFYIESRNVLSAMPKTIFFSQRKIYKLLTVTYNSREGGVFATNIKPHVIHGCIQWDKDVYFSMFCFLKHLINVNDVTKFIFCIMMKCSIMGYDKDSIIPCFEYRENDLNLTKTFIHTHIQLMAPLWFPC